MSKYSYSLDVGKELEKDLENKPLKDLINEAEGVEEAKVENETAEESIAQEDIHVSADQLSEKLKNIDSENEVNKLDKEYQTYNNNDNIFSYIIKHKLIILLALVLIIIFFWYFNNSSFSETNKISQIDMPKEDIANIKSYSFSNSSYNKSLDLKQTLIEGLS